MSDADPHAESPLQEELLQRLLACRPGDLDVAAFAETVKNHCGYFRRDVRNMLRQRGMGYVEESDVTDQEWAGYVSDHAADLADK